ALLVDVEITGAFVVAAVEIIDRRNTGLRRRLADLFQNLPLHARELDAPFSADMMMIALSKKTVLVLLEDRQHVFPAPAGQAELAPMIVVGGLAAHIDHGVDCRRSADCLAA